MNSKPILLFGMPRSGTTWIGKIFDSHPDTLYRHEPDSWGLLNDIPLLAPLEQAEQYDTAISRFIAAIPRMNQTKVSATIPVFRKNYYSPLQFWLLNINIRVSKLLGKIFGEVGMPQLVDYQANENIRLVWKSIESLGRLGVIAQQTECRAVQLVRHPCGYISSVLRGESKSKFTGATPSSDDFELFEMLLKTEHARAHGLTLDKLKQMTAVERLAWRWVLFNEKAYNDTKDMKNCTLALYEDFCDDPEGSARRLFEFCGLSWHPQVTAFLQSSTASENSAYYSVFKDSKKSANKWQKELSEHDVSAIMLIASKSEVGRLYLNK
jgi:hypothetical protein